MDNTNSIVVKLFSGLISNNRIPHAILIEGGTQQLRQEAVRYLATYAVCSSDSRPCGV